MTPLRPETADEVRHALDELAVARLPPSTWRSLEGSLRHLADALSPGDEVSVRAALVPVSRAVFEAKVRSRLGAPRSGAGIVVPTKRTPALPAVGAVCAAILILLGWQLGGGIVAAATAVLGLLVLVVALAGTRTNAERTAERQARTAAPDDRITAPGETSGQIAELRARLELR
jgi:hypothetical protein